MAFDRASRFDKIRSAAAMTSSSLTGTPAVSATKPERDCVPEGLRRRRSRYPTGRP
jgi:hypothetical protein